MVVIQPETEAEETQRSSFPPGSTVGVEAANAEAHEEAFEDALTDEQMREVVPDPSIFNFTCHLLCLNLGDFN
jgi:hypothetical protein